MKELFFEITGFEPYPFQLEIAEKIFTDEKNLVITASTGSGKTWLSCFPFVYAKLNNINFADRMFYVLPQRTLVTAVANTLKPRLKDYGINVTVQMGSQPDDPFFEGDIIVTTIDQLLSTYIGLPYSSSRNLSNIAPGSLVGSYIVLDEFHLLEVEKSLATFIDLSKRINPFSKILMMTATAPTSFVKEVSKKISGDFNLISPNQIVSLQKEEKSVRKRIVRWSDLPITSEMIVDQHKDRTLVVVNTVNRAQVLFKELQYLLRKKNLNIDVICLHARFLPQDRQEKEAVIKEVFKKDSDQEMIVVANQVVEVGLDISSSVLISELCPANALIQRIGRCTRYGEEEGEVFVHGIDQIYLPYKKEIMERTKKYLIEHQVMEITAVEEAKIVEEVHLDDDKITLEQIPFTRTRKEVNISLLLGETQYLKELIRDIRNIQVIIHPNPSELDLEKKPERFSIPVSTIQSGLKQIIDKFSLSENVFYPEFPDEWEKGQQPSWKPLQKIEDVLKHTLIALSPKIASYSREIGFVMNESGNYISKETASKGFSRKAFSYQKESYFEPGLQPKLAQKFYKP